jgi:hypothetical protein
MSAKVCPETPLNARWHKPAFSLVFRHFGISSGEKSINLIDIYIKYKYIKIFQIWKAFSRDPDCHQIFLFN